MTEPTNAATNAKEIADKITLALGENHGVVLLNGVRPLCDDMALRILCDAVSPDRICPDGSRGCESRACRLDHEGIWRHRK